jgi:tetratricopeptide (TPR) repeat protein
MKTSKSLPAIETTSDSINLLTRTQLNIARVPQILNKARALYNGGRYQEALEHCELAYEADAFRNDNLLLLGAIHFQLRNFSESIFYNQQCIRVDPNFAEAYSNLGNSLKELGDMKAATQFYLKVFPITLTQVLQQPILKSVILLFKGHKAQATVL